jgi:hypothetical protein
VPVVDIVVDIVVDMGSVVMMGVDMVDNVPVVPVVAVVPVSVPVPLVGQSGSQSQPLVAAASHYGGNGQLPEDGRVNVKTGHGGQPACHESQSDEGDVLHGNPGGEGFKSIRKDGDEREDG